VGMQMATLCVASEHVDMTRSVQIRVPTQSVGTRRLSVGSLWAAKSDRL
jgi:hypothetical protein